MRLFFARLDEKHNLLESFEKIFESFPKKIAKNAFFVYISKKLTNHSLIFAHFDEKPKVLRNFEKILKIFDENSIENLNSYFIFYFLFYFIFRKFVTKNRTFGNNTQQFFRFRGGGISPFPPWLRP